MGLKMFPLTYIAYKEILRQNIRAIIKQEF